MDEDALRALFCFTWCCFRIHTRATGVPCSNNCLQRLTRKIKTSCVNIFSSLMNMLAVTLQTNDADACLMTMCLRKYMKRLCDGLCFKMWNIEEFFLTEFNTLLTATK